MENEQKTIRTILVVDDTPANVDLLVAILSADYTVKTAYRGDEALDIARKTLPDLIMLDILMPEMNGYDVCMALKADESTRRIPIIFVTSMLKPDEEALGFKMGGVDYISKPINGLIVRARVKAHLALKEAQEELEVKNEALRQAREYAENIVETIRKPLVVLNSELKILTVNNCFYDTFKVTPEDTLGNFIYELGNRQWNIPALRLLFENILPHDTFFSDYEVEHTFQDIGHRIFTLNARQIYRKNIGSHIILLAMEDITERKLLEETIKHLAHYDTLTDLPNRQLFMELLDYGLASARRNGKKMALLFLDLNGFKQVNDTFGHSCGDLLLQEVARRLKTGIRESDTVARLGGDEFTVLMPDLARTDDVGIVLRKILGAFEAPFILNDVTVHSSISIGVSMFPDDGDCNEVLMKKADTAMYNAKGTGKNSYAFYNAEIGARTIDSIAALNGNDENQAPGIHLSKE